MSCLLSIKPNNDFFATLSCTFCLKPCNPVGREGGTRAGAILRIQPRLLQISRYRTISFLYAVPPLVVVTHTM